MSLIIEVDTVEVIGLGAEVALTDLPQQAVVLHEGVGDQVEVDLEVAGTPPNQIVHPVRKQKEI